MKIVIATGTYPPEIGGSSDYARHLSETLRIQNHEVMVVTYGELKGYVTGLRHVLYFFKLIVDGYDADYVIALDAFSVGFPALLFASIFMKKIVVRIGGDFLWEAYVDRTKEKILLSRFYDSKRKYSLKENIIRRIIGVTLRCVDTVVFSTEWQKKITLFPYRLVSNKTRIIENFYPPAVKKNQSDFREKIFLSPVRDRYIKNKKNLELAFEQAFSGHTDISLDTEIVSHELMLEKIGRSYAVILVSFSEVSPNLVLHSLECSIPVIMTKDTGIKDRLKDLVVFVDPFSIKDISAGIERLLEPSVYETYRQKIMNREFEHSWNEIAQEFLDVYNTL